MSKTHCDGSEGKGNVFAVRRGSRLDGPGVRTVVLFKGCSFSCWWCPSPELQSPAQELKITEGQCVRCGRCITSCTTAAARDEILPPPDNHHVSTDREICIVCGACISGCEGHARELVGQCMTVDEVMEQVLADLPLYEQTGGGVTFAGGEPLMQSEFLSLLLHACKSHGIHTAVDTSGYTPWEFLDDISTLVDLFFFDLKLMDEERHRRFTGLPNGLILENLRQLSQAGHRIVLRIPVIPGITDDEENMRAIVKFARGMNSLERIELVSYHPVEKEKYERLGKLYPIEAQTVPVGKPLEDLVQMFQANGLPALIFGAQRPEQMA